MASALQPGGSDGGSPVSAASGSGSNNNNNLNGNGNGQKGSRPGSTTPEARHAPPVQQGPTIFTFALKHRPRATRASVPKVRTGCKTCKKRHVKCDEAKPACSRCMKWQGFCEGYDAPPAADPEPEPEPERAENNNVDETATLATPRKTNTLSASPAAPHAAGTGYQKHAHNTLRASSTSSSSAATQASRRTTPSSDISVPESTTAVPVAMSKTEAIKVEPGLEDEIRTQDTQAEGNCAYQDSIYELAPLRRTIKRERDDDEQYDHSAYNAYNAYNSSSNQPFFDLSLINTPSSPGAGFVSDFPLEPNYNSVMFASQWEKHYFDNWLTLAPNLGGGWFPSHLWTSTIPQLCRDEPAVRFAAISIGAIAQAMSSALLGRSSYHLMDGGKGGVGGVNTFTSARRPVAAGSVVPHYRNALTYYGHALGLASLGFSGRAFDPTAVLNELSASGHVSAEKERAAVMCCLLFVCFEALQGNREYALRHITHGLQIVDQFVARNVPKRALSEAQDRQHHQDAVQATATTTTTTTTTTTATTASTPAPAPATIPKCTALDANVEIQRRRQRQRDRQLRLSTSGSTHGGGFANGDEQRPSDALGRLLTRSPAPYVLEDEVMQVFRRLDFQAWSLGVFRLRRTRPADIKFQALDALNPATIPARFDTLDDARRWWDLVQHWILQFPRYMVAALQRYMDANPDAAAHATAAGRMLDICDVPGAREIQREYLACLERWNAAFWPLYDASRSRGGGSPAQGFGSSNSNGNSNRNSYSNSSRNNDSEAAYLKAASLQIPYLLMWIGVSSLVYSDYEAMYQLTPQFRELNRLAALILPKQPRYSWSPFGGGASISGSGGSGGMLGSSFGGDLFTMDNGPTMALFVVSCKCRVEAVRNESIRLLAAYPRRDGFWDSKVLWAIADWNRVIEAENETEGSLYEQWLRLRQREAIFDETKPQVQMTAWVKNKETGKFEKLTQLVKWDM